ncbi:MAG: Ig-like domain-containing protein [Candidatus Krumholzibacteria bacterium]|nr:Ig-like domain-containing protein [Candidatus Krumholzibacteria bacterium]
MSYRLSIRWLSLLAAFGLVILSGCSDSDPATPANNNPDLDTTTPLVVNMTPDNHDNGVDLDRDIQIFFNEPMAQATLNGALTLSSGTVGDITWNDNGTVATVTHSTWAEATTVAVTVGTDLTDLAGNGIPQAFTSTFYTYSSVPAMVGYDFFGPSTAVPTDGFFIISFSEEMDLDSILAAYTLTEDLSKITALPGIIVGTFDGDYRQVTFRWDGQLTPLHTYHFSISTEAMTRTGTHLDQAFTLDFTAGTTVDETPPYIVSTEPALDTIVDPDLETITITFSERIDPRYDTPNSMSAMLDIFMAREPVWNDAGDELTVYLHRPLPSGIRFYAIWNESELHDIAGNHSTSADSLSFTTSGESSLFPVYEDLRIYYDIEEAKNFPQMARQTFENINGDDFERVLNKLTPSGYDDPMENWYMTTSGTDLMFRGFREGSGNIMFTPAINYLPGPLPETWSGTSTVATGEGTLNMNYTGTFVETYRWHLPFDKGFTDGVFLDNCVEVELYHEMVPAGSDVAVETGIDHIYLCPGLGVLHLETEGHEYEDGEMVDSWADAIGFKAASFDDRYER